jgi:hypothetical protein
MLNTNGHAASALRPKRAMDKRGRIIELNDQLRTTFRGGRDQMTPAVYNLDPQLRGRALFAMARCTKFDNSSEHDWGVMIFAGYAFEWHIEYRGKDGTGVSPDPADPDRTFRVLTLYLVEDLLAKHDLHSRSKPILLPSDETSQFEIASQKAD